jgi:hypothetical protein
MLLSSPKLDMVMIFLAVNKISMLSIWRGTSGSGIFSTAPATVTARYCTRCFFSLTSCLLLLLSYIFSLSSSLLLLLSLTSSLLHLLSLTSSLSYILLLLSLTSSLTSSLSTNRLNRLSLNALFVQLSAHQPHTRTHTLTHTTIARPGVQSWLQLGRSNLSNHRCPASDRISPDQLSNQSQIFDCQIGQSQDLGECESRRQGPAGLCAQGPPTEARWGGRSAGDE